jgi:Icc protein
MRRLAHLSDVHLLSEVRFGRDSAYAIRAHAVGLGRAVQPDTRAKKLERALAAVVASDVDRLVITGDLTELGHEAELELLGELLQRSGLAPERVSLLPGNHDAYGKPGGWARALAGPLAPWRRTSAAREDADVTRIDDAGAMLLLFDTTRHQSIFRSGGDFVDAQLVALERHLADAAREGKAAIVALHHPPFVRREGRAWKWLDSLDGSDALGAVLARYPQTSLLHGHHHRERDRDVPARIFGAPAVVDDGAVARVRIYEVDGDRLVATRP